MQSFWIFGLGALIVAAAAWWMMRAYVRAEPGKPRPTLPLIAAGSVGAGALGLYLLLGAPDLPDSPHAPRMEALKGAAAVDPEKLRPEERLMLLQQAARDNPTDFRPLFFSGLVLSDLGRDEEAARAFDAALRRKPDEPSVMLALGRTLVRTGQGAIPKQAVALFAEAERLDPKNPIPVFYQALAASQDGRWADATRLWTRARHLFPQEDPRQTMVAQMLEEARTEARTAK
jgi:cytochrome c-type biogenesis protein CcmH